ncbi:MAG: hypothetical protein MI746_01010 [Pseudomonadales bacterium]|nr:hypothetical protein [Pseudomonadales bacterium]
MSAKVTSWGELCDLAKIDPGSTPSEAAVHKVFNSAPMINTPMSNAQLKNLGFTKLEKRYDGTYENVTRTGTEKRFLDPKDPSSLPHLHKKIRD